MDDPSKRWVGRAPKPYLRPVVEQFLSSPQLAEPKRADYVAPRNLARRRCRGCGRRGLITAHGVASGHTAKPPGTELCPGSYKRPKPRRRVSPWVIVAAVMLSIAAIGRFALRIF